MNKREAAEKIVTDIILFFLNNATITLSDIERADTLTLIARAEKFIEDIKK